MLLLFRDSPQVRLEAIEAFKPRDNILIRVPDSGTHAGHRPVDTVGIRVGAHGPERGTTM